jgi:hypothetical protein
MAERRRYTARTRAKAVGIAMVDGVTAAERVTGIPKQTIHQWTEKPEYGQLRTTAREVVVQELWVGLQVGVKVLTEGLEGDAPLNHKAAAFDSLAERYALLNGEATTRTENRELLNTFNDGEKEALAAWLHDVAKERVDAA